MLRDALVDASVAAIGGGVVTMGTASGDIGRGWPDERATTAEPCDVDAAVDALAFDVRISGALRPLASEGDDDDDVIDGGGDAECDAATIGFDVAGVSVTGSSIVGGPLSLSAGKPT